MGASLAGLLGLAALASPSAAVDPAPCGYACSIGDGNHLDFALARYNADGSLDPSFGRREAVPANLLSGSSGYGPDARSVLVQPDRKIVVAGDTLGGSLGELALARYNPDGSPDPSFGDGGRAITDLGQDHAPTARAAVRQPDGDIVVAGSAGSDFALARYRPDGSPDTTFGNAGIVTTDFGGKDGAEAVALQPDGMIVAAGAAGASMALARYGPDGSLDASFGTGGEAVIHDRSMATGVLVQPSGGIVATERSCSGDGAGFRLSRFGRDGSLDRTFGHGGTASVRVGRDSCAEAAALQPDGRIVVAGESHGGPTNGDVALARFNPNGTLDPSFGADGEMVTPRPGSDRAKAVLLEPDGKIVVAGMARVRDSRVQRIAVSRYNPNGSLDPSFGDRGEAISKRGRATAAALETDGKIVVAGSSPLGGHAPGRGEVARAGLDGARATPGRQPARASSKRRRRRAPHPVPAWFINASSFKELKRFAAADACAFARTQPAAAKRTLILDFGGARAYRGGRFGAAVNHASILARNWQISTALRVAADAYASCHRRGRARIAYANTNYFDSVKNAQRAWGIGVNQARTMRGVRAYVRRRGYRPVAGVGVAGDIEMGYWGPGQSKAMVNGAKSVWHRGYLDFGTAGGCPPYPKGVHERGCFNRWSVGDVGHVSYGGGGKPLPEVYYWGGPHRFDQAAEWAHVAKAWNARHASWYQFAGATGSTEFGQLTPRESWKRLRAKAPGRVRRELLNFQQDRRRAMASAKARPGDG